jgi:hypothetical protein
MALWNVSRSCNVPSKHGERARSVRAHRRTHRHGADESVGEQGHGDFLLDHHHIAFGKPNPGRCSPLCGYTFWFAGVSAMAMVVPSTRLMQRPRVCPPSGIARCIASPTPGFFGHLHRWRILLVVDRDFEHHDEGNATSSATSIPPAASMPRPPRRSKVVRWGSGSGSSLDPCFHCAGSATSRIVVFTTSGSC